MAQLIHHAQISELNFCSASSKIKVEPVYLCSFPTPCQAPNQTY